MGKTVAQQRIGQVDVLLEGTLFEDSVPQIFVVSLLFRRMSDDRYAEWGPVTSEPLAKVEAWVEYLGAIRKAVYGTLNSQGTNAFTG